MATMLCASTAFAPGDNQLLTMQCPSVTMFCTSSPSWGVMVRIRSERLYCGVCCSQGQGPIRGGLDSGRRTSRTFSRSRAKFGLDKDGFGVRSRFLSTAGQRTRGNRQPVLCLANSAPAVGSADGVDSEKVSEDADSVTKLLRETPSQVERKYKVGDHFYTLREKQVLQRPWWKNLTLAASYQIGARTRELDGQPELGSERPHEEENATRAESGANASVPSQGPIYLSDLLRQYKGNLFIPEEAVERHDLSELEKFNRDLDSLPQMTFEDCWDFLISNKIELLTSRGVPFPRGGFVYWDFVVNFKEAPGEKTLQHRKWAMHLHENEAQALLSEYSGPQREVETTFTPSVLRPTSFPHPVASSISARLVTELGVIFSIMSAVAVLVGGAAVNVGYSVLGTTRTIVVQVVWPTVFPLLRPFVALVVNIAGGSWNVIVAVASGKRGPGWLVSEAYRLWRTGVLFSSARTLGAILFVLIAMAALAKFTLTRRPKDFTKWDLWQAIEFGHSKPQARVEGTTGVGFADVAGINDVVKELQELVSYLREPERFNRMGTKPPHGVLMEGPPGCGKTLLAKAIAGEAGVPFYQMAGSEFVEVLVGVGAARVRDLFKRAKVNRPSVVFIDEIDALGAIRHGAAGDEGMESYNAGAQERETTLNQLLIELDGFDTGKGVVFLGATNRMDMLDPALLRPGRFDRKIQIRPPRAQGRLEILKVHAKSVKLDESVDLWMYAKNLPGWSGAELAQLLQESALVAVRHGGTVILRHDMDEALDRLTMGPVRLGFERRQPVHRRMATHEIGLAMTSHLLRRLENASVEFADRVSIVPRGETLARTIFDKLEDEAYIFERRPTLIHRMQVLLGGRAAEEVLFGRDTSTLSAQHLPDASWLARKMVSIWNLEGGITIQGDINPWELQGEDFSGPPMGFEGGLYNNYGFHEKVMNYDLIDDVANRTKALLDQTYEKTLQLLIQHKAALTKAVYVVMEKEELYGEELELILDQYPPNNSPKSVEEEGEPGALLSENAAAGSSNWTSAIDVSAEEVSKATPSGSGDAVDKWSRQGVKMDSVEAERPAISAGRSEEVSGSADAWWGGEPQASKSNGSAEVLTKEATLDRGESWEASSLEGGDVAATNRNVFVESSPEASNRGGFGESSPDASVAASVTDRNQ